MSTRFILGALSSASKLRNITSLSNNFHASTSTLLLPSYRRLSSDALTHDASVDDSNIKCGIIHRFDPKRAFGFIRPDGVEATAKIDQMVFFHINDIETLDINGESINPNLLTKPRVQFKVKEAPSDKGSSMKARDVTLEGGRLFPPFHKDHLEKYTRVQKAKFGDRIYEIMESVSEESDMEKKIVEAYDKCAFSIEREKRRVQKIEEVYERDTSS